MDVERVLCLTATATKQVAEDICASFFIFPEGVFRTPMYRPKWVSCCPYCAASLIDNLALLLAWHSKLKSSTTSRRRSLRLFLCWEPAPVHPLSMSPYRSMLRSLLIVYDPTVWMPWCTMPACPVKNARRYRCNSWNLIEVLYVPPLPLVWA